MKIWVTIAIVALALGCTTARRPGQGGVPELPTTISVRISGEVYHPDTYSLPAGARLLEAISRAGGFTESGFKQGVEVADTKGRTLRYDLRRVTIGTGADPVVHDGDTVIVHRGGVPE